MKRLENVKEDGKPYKISKYSNFWRELLPAVKITKTKKNTNQFLNENNKRVNPYYHEMLEQYLITKWVKPTDVVLEIGARYGIASYTIQTILNDKKNHVIVEPDSKIKDALKLNKKTFKMRFKSCFKVIANKPQYFYEIENNGLGNYTLNEKKDGAIRIPRISSKAFFHKYNLPFNVIVVDCEACFCSFFAENEKFVMGLDMIIVEVDAKERCDYDANIFSKLKQKFIKVDDIMNGFQQVWVKKVKKYFPPQQHKK